jgi:branched-chain amino acid transport system permease protein
MMKHSVIIIRVGVLTSVALLIGLPLALGDPTITSVGVYVLLFTGAAVAWNMFSGYTGYVSLGHATYYGVGAYTLAMLCKAYKVPAGVSPFLLLPVCGIVAALFAIPLGWIALHTRRYAFVVITIAIFFIMQLLSYNLSFTSGPRGIFLPTPDWGPDVYDLPFYYVALAIFLLAALVSWRVRRSKFGLDLLAIRDDEERARSLGVPAGRYKLLAYALSAFFFGMVGAEVVYYVGIAYPSFAFNPAIDVTVALICFLGGAGTILGPIMGGLLFEPLQQFLDLQFSSVAAGFELVLLGGLLLAVILFLPDGIVPSLQMRWVQWSDIRRRRRRSASVADAPRPDDRLLPEQSRRGKG